jgi:hypothetical protein
MQGRDFLVSEFSSFWQINVNAGIELPHYVQITQIVTFAFNKDNCLLVLHLALFWTLSPRSVGIVSL